MTNQQPFIDALLPGEIARRVEAANIKRAALPVASLIVLGVLGGIYIACGGALATLALTESSLGFGISRMAAGVAFSLGLIMLVLGGGELFTGNNLMVVALAQRQGVCAVRLAELGHVLRRQCCRGALDGVHDPL